MHGLQLAIVMVKKKVEYRGKDKLPEILEAKVK